MASRLEEWLTELTQNGCESFDGCKKTHSIDDVYLVEKNVKNITSVFNDEAVPDDVEDLMYALLFDEEIGILNFIHEASCHSEIFSKSIADGFHLLSYLIEVNRRKKIKKYTQKIEDHCWKFWMEKDACVLKENALKVLISLYVNSDLETNASKFETRINQLMREISVVKKVKVSQLQYHLLGVLCKKYPGKMKPKFETISRLFIYQLEQKVKDKALTNLRGRMEGLCGLLHVYSLSDQPSNEIIVIDAVKVLVSMRNLSTKEAPRAALNLFSVHGSQFSRHILKDYSIWHTNLWHWASSDLAEDSIPGRSALKKFYQVISELLIQDPAEGVHLIYKDLMQALEKQEYWRGFAVVGFGFLSTAAKHLFGNNEVLKIFNFVESKIMKKFFRRGKDYQTSLSLLPTYLETLGIITSNLDHVTMDQVLPLQEITVHLIENYPNFDRMKNHQCAETVITVTCQLMNKGSLVNVFLENVLYQGLLRSCSFPIQMDIELLKEELKDRGQNASAVTGSLQYVPFWQALFTPSRSQTKGIDASDYEKTLQLLFHQFISSTQLLLSRLDLSLVKEEDDIGEVSPVEAKKKCLRPKNEYGLASSTPKDFVIFCNLVSIVSKVFPRVEMHLMEDHLIHITLVIIGYSEDLPLISGFYKLLESCLLVYTELKYFEGMKNPGESINLSPADGGKVNKDKLLSKLKKFLQNMLVRMKHYKGDLKLSCLQVLLATPTPIIRIILPHLVSPMKTVFEIGCSNYKMADAGIGALEKWNVELPSSEWDPVLRQILPSLNSFIKIGDHHEIESSVGLTMEKLNKASSSKRKYLVAKRRLERKGNWTDLKTREEMQRKCLLFLGQLSPSTVQAFIGDENDSEQVMAWDTQDHLPLAIPFPNIDQYPCIYIDKFLPRIVNLSLKSSERRTRIAACEVLHAFIMYLLGKGVQLSAKNPNQLSKLVEKLAPSIIQLGCCSDDTAKTLFQKLMFSLSNWYARKLDSQESFIWIDALFDGVCDADNAAVREQCADCLKEFVAKMLTSEGGGGRKLVLGRVEDMLEKICSFSLHSNQYRRIGAAMALNSLIPAFEEISLLNPFAFELLYCQLMALEMSDVDGSASSNWWMIRCIRHLEKIVKSQASVFNVEDAKKRRKPPEFEGVVMKDLVCWLLSKIGSLGYSCRKECMRLFLSLAPCVQGYSGPEYFISKVIEDDGVHRIIGICEAAIHLERFPYWLSSVGTQKEKCSREDILSLLDWFSSLSTSLQCYVWIFENNLLQPTQIFFEDGRQKIFSCVSEFLSSHEKFNNKILDGLSELSVPLISVLREGEGEKCCGTSVCGVSTFVFKFLCCLHRGSTTNEFVKSVFSRLWTSSLWNLVAKLIFEPCLKDCDKGNGEILSKVLKNLFEVLASLPVASSGAFFKALDSKIQRINICELEEIQAVLTGDKLFMYMDLVESLLFLQECSPSSGVIKWSYMNKLDGNRLLQCIFEALFTRGNSDIVCEPLNHTKLKYLESLLRLSLREDGKVERLTSLIADDQEVRTMFSQSNMTKGDHFLICFKSCIMSHLFANLRSSFDCLLQTLLSSKREAACNTIMKVIQDLFADKRIKQSQMDFTFISDCLSTNWRNFEDLTQKKEWNLRLLEILLAIYVAVPGSIEIFQRDKLSKICITSVLLDKQPCLEETAKALQLLPIMIRNQDEETIEELRSHLQQLIIQHFHNEEKSESSSQTNENPDRGIIFERLLVALELTSSPMLLKFIICHSSGGSVALKPDSLEISLSETVKRSNYDQQLKLLTAVYSVASGDGTENIRLGAVNNFLSKLIKVSDQSIVETFYKESVATIFQTLKKGFVDNPVGKRSQLISKIVSFQLLQIMFVGLNKRLEEPECSIFLEDKGVEMRGRSMIQKLMHMCLNGMRLREHDSQLKELGDLMRRYRCAAYNTAVSILANLRRETKAFKYVFEAYLSEGKRLWECFVDTSSPKHLPSSFDVEPEVVAVDAPICEGEESQRKRMRLDCSVQSSVFLSTQEYLADSTLNEDITKFDYLHCSVRSFCWINREPGGDGVNPIGSGVTSSLPVQVMHERDPANEHDCMTSVTTLIKHLLAEGILPSGNDSQDFDWLNSIKESIEHSDRHGNVKIFLVRVVLNCEQELADHAEILMTPLMMQVGNGFLGHRINYLISDVIQTLLGWWRKNPNIMLSRTHTTQMFHFFALKTDEPHFADLIFKEYKNIIREMCEQWMDLIDVPFDEILAKLESERERSKDLGLFLSQLFLKHSKEPWRPGDKIRFLKGLQLCYSKKTDKFLLLKSSFVIGQVLRTIDPEDIGKEMWKSLEESENDFISSVISRLQEMKTGKQKENFLRNILEIQHNYSSIVDEFYSFILCLLPKVQGKLRTIGMSLISSRVEKRPFYELRDQLQQWLTTNVPEDQQIALKIVKKILPELQDNEIWGIVISIQHLRTSASTGCRKLMYEILIWVFDNFCLSDWEQTPGTSSEDQEDGNQTLGDKVTEMLLFGLVDEEISIQSLVFSFFEKKPGLKSGDNTQTRFLNIVRKLYSPETESSFLGYALTLLLSPLSSTPKYKELLFEHPLADCCFVDYQPRTSIRTLDLDMSPMFTDSLATTLTQVHLDPQLQSQNSSAISSKIMASQRSLVFSGGTLASPSFGVSGPSGDGMEGRSNTLLGSFIPRGEVFRRPIHVKRRSLGRHKSRAYYATIENIRSVQRTEMIEEKARKRDSEITLHRKFRVGDFPDIQIHYCDIFEPLCAVAKRDSVIAQQLFVSIASGILEGSDCFEMLAEGRKAFTNILKRTKNFSGHIRAVLEIALRNVKYFELNVDSVVKVIDPNGLAPLACLFLEARLNKWRPEQKSRLYDRRRADDDKKLWLQLAIMYQQMEEYDVVHGIFHDMLKCEDNVKKALEYERSGHWSKGKTAFREILENLTPGDSDVECIEDDYYYEGYFKCFESLSRWSDLNKVVMKQLEDNFDDVWSDGAFFVPWLIKCQVNLGLEHDSNTKEFYQYISTLKDKDQKDYLQSKHSRELALIYSLFGQYERARNFVQEYYDSFLEEWPLLSPLSSKIKAPKLLSTQLTSELSLFLLVMNNHETHQLNTDFKRLCSMWEVNLPNKMEPLNHWDHRIACRQFFIKKMIASDVAKGIPGEDHGIDLDKISAIATLSLVDMAISAQNFDIADKYLRNSESMLKNHSNSALRLQWHISRAILPRVKGGNCQPDSPPQLKWFVEAWKSLVSICEEGTELLDKPDLYLRAIQEMYTVSKSVHRVFRRSTAEIDNLDIDIRMNIQRLIHYSSGSTSSMVERISEYTIELLEKSVDVAKDISDNCIADQYLELAKFCQYLMEDSADDREELSMRSILKAMAHGSQQARQWFPCILLFTRLYSSLSGVFKSESSRVPTWMFLSWTSQILAHLNGSSCSTLTDLVVRMAETYPAAIVYPFQISIDKYQKENSEEMRALTNRLEKILFRNKLLEKMLESLKYVCLPNVMLKGHLERIKLLLDSPNCGDAEVMEQAKSLLVDELFPQSRGRGRGVGAPHHGTIIPQLREYEKDIRKIVGALSASLSENKRNNILKQLDDYANVMKKKYKKPPSELKCYSLWLHEFRSLGHRECVELPGQYSGDFEPRVEENVRIVGFLPKVAVMTSLRQPICITVIGSDAKEHKLLVKNGEDLRLDQRIEQLFGLMNKILAANAATKERRLHINTYEVTPLTRSLGVIEWVDNTLPLRNLLILSMDQDEQTKLNSVCEENMNWMGKGTNNLTEVFKYSMRETVTAFTARANAFQCDLLRRSLLKLSLSLDGFWSLRNAFATSHAVLCIAHWLLGIGDRHLANTLFSMASGNVIGIDFGYSFGTSTQFLPVPELIPFRMTPQIMGLMQPMGEVGLIKESMIHALRSFQENYEILLATVDVFVKEPSVDWLDQARKKSKKEGVPASKLDEFDAAFVKGKIALMRRKFVGGTNPKEITLEELGARFIDRPDILRKMKEVATGDLSRDRAKKASLGLTCEEQVACLIDQATDYHVLGKTYCGWWPWL
ncbi:DNA-dependent protein kinase catalytic subunit-like [Ischnura elegans]|uniref:DNA-dependent protein kinase catalytic subunit-like n=1 Tax=Ischnura elegans TaxID=197161 RepID=UPI001ED8B224|nr:DNA-dependent protein kinase catalytic subunit-like [Ischnura elegans]